jgi:plasmid stability protein
MLESDPSRQIHSLTPSWKARKAGSMETIMDLPEDLIQEMKFRAVRDGRKLRDVAKEVLRRGLAAQSTPAGGITRHRVNLPIIPSPPGAKPFEIKGDRLLELATEAERTDPSP